jgi:hypothetical protein
MAEPSTTLKRSGRAPWILLAVVIVVAIGFGLWRFLRGPPLEEVLAEKPRPPAEAAPQPEAKPAPPPDAATTRSLLDAVSPHPLVRRGLSEGDVVRRWVVVTDNLAEGVSPRAQLGFLAPPAPFSVERRGAKTVVAPAAYARYDAFADAVSSVDAAALSRVYGALHGVLEAAYRALGYPNASLDKVTARALRRVANAPVPPGEAEVVPIPGGWAFADPGLESLSQVEKHVLRLGPRNARLVQAKARELLALLPAGAR